MISFVPRPTNASKATSAEHKRINAAIEKLTDDSNDLAVKIHSLKSASATGFHVSSAHELQQERWSQLERELSLREQFIAFLEGPYQLDVVEASRIANEKPSQIQAEIVQKCIADGYPEESLIPAFWLLHPTYRHAYDAADSASSVVSRIGGLVHENYQAMERVRERMEAFKNKTLTLA